MSSHRERITITIRQDLLHALDGTIDHQRIRNRSHALEIALARSLDTDTHQAVILASGEGVKMRPFTYEIPKPLIPVKDKPILEHGIAMLRDNGIRDIIITISHLGQKIEDHFGDGSKYNVKITYVHENKPSGTGGALRAAKKHIQNAPFFVLYGDVLLDLDIADFMQAHQSNKAAVSSIALTSVADPSAYGAVKMRGLRVVEFSEKPIIDDDTSRLVFAGCAAFNPSVFNFITKQRGSLSLEQDIFPELIEQGRLFGYPFEGQWFDVATPEVYDQVLKQWRK